MFLPTWIKDLLSPPASLLLLAALGGAVWRWRPRLGGALVAAALGLLALLSMPAVSGALIQPLIPAPVPAVTPNAAAAEAIVVLGGDMYFDAPEYGGDTVGGMTLERLRYGAWLHRRTGLPLLLSGGPLHPGSVPVAEAMAATLRDEFGLEARWVENRSPNTRGNARASAELLKAAGRTKIYLVTSAFHMPRAVPEFEAAGLVVVPAPTHITGPRDVYLSDFLPRAGGLLESSIALHEWMGRIWYRLTDHD
ncbi:MAG TPA: YdcF family protein [Candidatus Polarisedimenticolaceae bacterium]|nr:YdcF family protein [Candidatus Polarisedimenticolaceae bacterium]